MSLWQLADDVFLNSDLGSFIILSDGVVTSVPLKGSYAPRILAYFLQYPNTPLRNEEIGRYAWDFDPSQVPSPHDVQVHVGKLRSQLAQLNRPDRPPCCSVETCTNPNGYLFSCPGLRQVDRIPEQSLLLTYYRELWTACRPGMIRDRASLGPVRDLIDFYCLPVITDGEDRPVTAPFCQVPVRAYVTAGSGFGKTVLLQILTLTALAPLLESMDSPLVTELSPEALEKYRFLRDALFGPDHPAVFPVLIHACRYNDPHCRTLSGLAQGGGFEGFDQLLDCAHREGQLLFLVDGLDEVEQQYTDSFSDRLNDLLVRYPRAGAVFTSRFVGRQEVTRSCCSLHLSALTDEAIRSITCAVRQPEKAARLLKLFDGNPLLHRLVTNPFVLLTTLESRSDYQLHSILDSVISAIINRRWRKLKEVFSSGGSQYAHTVKLLLGHLACSYIFDCRSSAELSWIRRTVARAPGALKQCGVSLYLSPDDPRGPDHWLGCFLDSLSSQSGILNVVEENEIEYYVFQDELVMCRLASLYLNEWINNAAELEDRDEHTGLAANAAWLQRFVSSFSSAHPPLSSEGVTVLVLSLVTSEEFMQKSILSFLLCREACSCDPEERAALARGCRAIRDNVFGENVVANLPDSRGRLLIERMLRSHGGEDL